jgi:hypothetical protein
MKTFTNFINEVNEAAQYPLRNRPHDAELSRKDIKNVKSFAERQETHHEDRAYQHEMESEEFPAESEAHHAHREAADKHYSAANHYAKLGKNPQSGHDQMGGKRMKRPTEKANDASKRAHAAADKHVPHNADEDDGIEYRVG